MSITEIGDEGFVKRENQYIRKTNSEIKQLALDYFGKNVFGSWGFNDNDKSLMQNVFMPLIFMDDLQRKALVRDKVVHIYGYVKDSINFGINGYPIFHTISFMDEEDFDRFRKACLLIEEFIGDDDAH